MAQWAQGNFAAAQPPSGGWAAPVPRDAAQEGNRDWAITGLVVGIASILASVTIFFGIPMGILGIVFSRLGRRSPSSRAMATWGLALSIVGLVFSLALAALGVLGLIIAATVR